MRLSVAVLFLVGMALAGPVSNATLAHKVRADPRSADGKAAMEELGRRGPEGLRWLVTLVRDVARKDAGAARDIVRVLAPHRDMVARAWRDSLPAVVRADLLLALAPGYPEEKARLERGLFDAELPRRRALLAALAEADLPGDVVRRCLADEALADAAFSILLDRGWSPPPKELRLVARNVVQNVEDPNRICRELKSGRLWGLMEAVADLSAEMIEAHVLLLRVSGLDIARDPLLWKSWIAAKRESYEIPEADAPGRITAAILQGAEFLRADLLADGKSVMEGRHEAGATALSIFALVASGVPADDPAITKALATTIFDDTGALAPEALRHEYTCSITIMALAALDKEKYRHKIQKLASLLIASQLENGQWSYNVHDRYAQTKRPVRRRPYGDNSNTQYALLGLRVARQAGADVPPETWMRAMTFWLSGLKERGWTYGPLHSQGGATTSMTAAGISSIAICLEGLHGKDAARHIAANVALKRGLKALGWQLLQWGYRSVDHYGFYGIERACILTGVHRFNDFDWYRVGAIDLITRQKPDGSFPPGMGGKSWRYGAAIDTAYALLFLKRATTPIAGVREGGVVEVPRKLRRPARSRMHE